jgi:ACS family glucarate transporter-like MFS transporter
VNDSAAPVPLLASRPTKVRHFVLAALCFITTVSYLQRNSLGGAETTVRADLSLDKIDTGQAMGAFFLTYALCQVPSGWLAQRWGGRRALTTFAAGWSMMMAVCAAATSLPVLVGARATMGVLQAGIFPCCTMILATWYPATRRGFTSAALNSFMLLGGVIASWLTAELIGPLGWRWLFLLYAVPGIVWAVWFARWFRNRPQDHPSVNNAELAIVSPQPGSLDIRRTRQSLPDAAEPDERILANREALSTGESPKSSLVREGDVEIPNLVQRVVKPSVPWLAIFLSWSLWWICIQQFCRAGVMRFFDMWLPTYLQEARGQSIEAANYWTSLPMLAGILGGMIGGIVSDFVLVRTGSRRAARQGVAAGSILVALLIYGMAYRLADVNAAVLLASFGLFIWTFSSPMSYALSMDMGGPNLGIIFATMNMAGNLGAWAFTQFFPLVVDWSGWDGGLLVFAAMHVVSIGGWLLINPNGIIGERAETPNSKE